MTILSWANLMNRVQSSPRITVSTSFSWKDLDDDETVANESTAESRSTQKDMKNQRSHREKSKASFASEPKKPKKWSWRHPWSTQKNSKPSVILMAWTSRLTNLQCVHKYADEWQWIFLKILTLSLFRNRERNSSMWTAGEHEFYRKRAGRAAEANLKWLSKNHFGCFELSSHTVVSLGAKFNNRDSPWDKKCKRGLCFAPYGAERVTLSPCKQALTGHFFPLKNPSLPLFDSR